MDALWVRGALPTFGGLSQFRFLKAKLCVTLQSDGRLRQVIEDGKGGWWFRSQTHLNFLTGTTCWAISISFLAPRPKKALAGIVTGRKIASNPDNVAKLKGPGHLSSRARTANREEESLPPQDLPEPGRKIGRSSRKPHPRGTSLVSVDGPHSADTSWTLARWQGESTVRSASCLLNGLSPSLGNDANGPFCVGERPTGP